MMSYSAVAVVCTLVIGEM